MATKNTTRDNSRLMDISEHELSDIIEIITPELDGTRAASKPYLRVVEQPTRKPMRFRYKCEGRTAGTIPGENSYQETKTFPTVEIVGYTGEALILVSCVTKDKPYRQHPHQLVGKNCKNGFCTRNVGPGLPLRAEFSNVGIQCVRKKEIAESLEERKIKKIDPFKNGFEHINDPSSIELNTLRLCFQGFLKGTNGWEPVSPVVSEPLYDRKAKSELIINRLCSCAATIDGGEEIILLCSKVNKDDVKIRFKAIDNSNEVWHSYAEFEPSNVHKQTAIVFRTPRYPQADLPKTAKTFIELECPSLNKRSDPLEFVFHNPGMLSFEHMQRKLKHKPEIDIFQHVLTKHSYPPTDIDLDSDNNGTLSTEHTESTVSKQPSLNTNDEIDYIDHRTREIKTDNVKLELEVPQIEYEPKDVDAQTSITMNEILNHPLLIESHPLTIKDKINEWMHFSELERTDSLTVENGDTISPDPITVYTNINSLSTISTATDDDRCFTDYMKSTTEIDDIGDELMYCHATFNNPAINNFSYNASPIADDKSIKTMVDEISSIPNKAYIATQKTESFDERIIQIVFRNSICIPITETKVSSSYISNEDDDLVILKNPPAPKICVNVAQTPSSSHSSPLFLPPRTPSPGPEQKLPPLPPKHKNSQKLIPNSPTLHNTAVHSRNNSISSRPPSQIFIMKTPNQSPTKQQSTPITSPKKSQGFFSRLFSRRKIKIDTDFNFKSTNKNSNLVVSKISTLNMSNEHSIGNFPNCDPNRSPLSSIKSSQSQLDYSQFPTKTSEKCENNRNGKPLARSVSSVSGKRRSHLNSDIVHIPLKGDNAKSLQNHAGQAFTFGQYLDRRTVSALQLANIPINDGNMELVAIADRQSIKNLCGGEFGVTLDSEVDLQEAEHFALYTKTPPYRSFIANTSDVNLKAYEGINDEQLLTTDEVARRLNEANRILSD